MTDGFVLKASKRAEAAPNDAALKNANQSADIGYGKTKWRQERIWVESVDRENKAVKEWQEKWSFMADYDPKGNLKEKKKMPERVNMYSDKLPSSCGHNYGHRIYSQEAQQISAMESSLAQNYRKRRNNDLICYD